MKLYGLMTSTAFAWLLLASSPAAAVITLTVGNDSAPQGGTATISVSVDGIAAGGVKANNAQLDIIFDPAVFETPNPTADCTPASRFATGFQPSEGLPTVSGTQRIRLSIIDNTEPLGDVTDGELFTCVLHVKATAVSGPTTLQATRLNVGDTSGAILTSTGGNGTVTVGSAPPQGITITVGNATAAPGGTAIVVVTLAGVATGGVKANNAQLDIIFDPAVFETPNPTADCVPASRFANGFQPSEGLPTVSGTQRIRLSIIDNTEPLGDVTDGELFTCTLRLKAGAVLPTTLQATRLNVGDTSGAILASTGVNGTVTVGGGGTPLPTVPPTAPPTPTPTETRRPTVPPTTPPTATRPATPTATKPPATATKAPAPAPSEDDDGCQISTNGNAGTAWLLLIPAIGLVAMRRRSR